MKKHIPNAITCCNLMSGCAATGAAFYGHYHWAVVMIVDSVEAACRSLKVHTKETTDTMIDNLIDGKIKEGQLDNCPLSYGDIAKMRKMLKTKMMSIYHVRVEYPRIKN